MKFSTFRPPGDANLDCGAKSQVRLQLCRCQLSASGQRHRRARDGAADAGFGCAVDQSGPALRSPDFEVAVVELGDHGRQPVHSEHLGGRHVDAAVGRQPNGVERRVVGAGIGQPRQPILLVAQSLVHLFDAALVGGGHVE